MLDFQIIIENIALIIAGLKTTFLLAFFGNITSLFIGTLIGVGKTSNRKPIKIFASLYIELFRNLPLLIVVYFFFYGLSVPPLIAGFIGLCMYTSAYMAEVVRAGVQSVSAGELRAADALGMTFIHKVIYIILPQAFRIIIAPMSSQFMNLTKNTSIVYFVSVADITYTFETLSAQTFKFYEFFTVAALTYMITCWCIAYAVVLINKWMQIPGLSSIDMEA